MVPCSYVAYPHTPYWQGADTHVIERKNEQTKRETERQRTETNFVCESIDQAHYIQYTNKILFICIHTKIIIQNEIQFWLHGKIFTIREMANSTTTWWKSDGEKKDREIKSEIAFDRL